MADARKYVAVKPARLSASVSAAATSMTLSEISDREGNTLTLTDFGTKGFAVINPGGSDEEQIVFTAISGTTVSGISNVIMRDPYTETSGFSNPHAAGVTVVIYTNSPAFYADFANKSNDETIKETWTFTSTKIPIYDVDPTFTDDKHIISKKYADDLAIAGSPDATPTVKGIQEVGLFGEIDSDTALGGTGASITVRPDQLALSKYGLRLPTVNEQAAMDGTQGTPSATNKFVTEEDATRLVVYGTTSTGTDSYVLNTTPSIVSVDGTKVHLTIDVDNTLVATLNFNGEGSLLITYGSGTSIPTGTFKAGDTLSLIKTGIRWQLQNPPKALVDGSEVGLDFHTHPKLVASTLDTTLTSNTLEQTITTYTVPADLLSTKHGIKVRLSLNHSANINGDDTTIRFKFGSTTLTTVTLDGTAGTNDRLRGEFVILNTATNAQVWALDMIEWEGTTPGTGEFEINSGTAAEDTTSDRDFVITSQTAADGTNPVIVRLCINELIFAI